MARRLEITILIPDSFDDEQTSKMLRQLIRAVSFHGATLFANHYPNASIGKAAAYARDLLSRLMGATQRKA